MTNQVPDAIGAWCLIGIVAASMSTADGAILAIGTVFSHNLMRQFDMWFPNFVRADNLLLVTRVSTLPFAAVAAVIAAYYKADNGATSGTGYLLIVAFDIVLATVVPSLFGCFYAKTPRPNAALLSFLVGIIVRIVLEFVLPKDGWLLLPYDQPEYYNYGAASSANVPVFVDAPANITWNPEDPAQACDQVQYKDYQGVDSLAAFAASILTFVTVQYLEHKRSPLGIRGERHTNNMIAVARAGT
jgi:Na+/proline symporter